MGLCTLAQVKEWLTIGQVTPDTSSDALLTRLIAAESAAIEKWCGRAFATASYTEAYNGTGTGRLFLRQLPVTAVSAVTVNGLSVPASTGPLVAGFAFDSTGLYIIGYILSSTQSWPSGINGFPAGYQNVTVTYSGGFAAVPDDIAQACVELVGLRFAEKRRIGKTTETLAGQTTSYLATPWPASVKSVLETYRKVTP